MRILRIITRLNTGGPAIQAIDLTRELHKRGHECELVVGLASREEGQQFQAKAMGQLGDKLGFSSTLQRELNWYCDRCAFKAIRKKIQDFQPDIVHTHTAKAGFLGRLAAITIRPRPKLVHTFHGHVFHSYFNKYRSWFYLFLERWLAGWTDKLIAVSRSQMDELINYHLFPRYGYEVIPLGFDLEPFLKVPMWKYKKRLNVGIVGRLTAVKDHELFFEFVNALRRITSVEVKAFVIGSGERRAELQRKYKDALFMGEVRHSALSAVYENLDLVVCSSKNEGTPVALIEAMAAGRPVLGTSVGGVKDLIGRDDRYEYPPFSIGTMRGFYLYSPQQAANDITHSLDLESYHFMIARAREYVKKTYSLDRLVDSIEHCYRSIPR